MLMREVRTLWDSLPVQSLDSLLAGRRPLILAPHPDDESLGCGGLLAQCARAGISARVAILTDGRHSHPGSLAYPPSHLAAVRRQEASEALTILGLPLSNLFWIGAEDTRLPGSGAEAQAIVASLAEICTQTRCGIVLSPWRHDPHCDHEAAADLGLTLSARTGLPVMSYPVWGWTLPDDHVVAQPQGGLRLDITGELDLKQSAIRAHATQYGGVITDSSEGFTLPERLLSVFRRPYETFLIP